MVSALYYLPISRCFRSFDISVSTFIPSSSFLNKIVGIKKKKTEKIKRKKIMYENLCVNISTLATVFAWLKT